MGLVRVVKILGMAAAQKAKPSTDMFDGPKQTVKSDGDAYQ